MTREELCEMARELAKALGLAIEMGVDEDLVSCHTDYDGDCTPAIREEEMVRLVALHLTWSLNPVSQRLGYELLAFIPRQDGFPKSNAVHGEDCL